MTNINDLNNFFFYWIFLESGFTELLQLILQLYYFLNIMTIWLYNHYWVHINSENTHFFFTINTYIHLYFEFLYTGYIYCIIILHFSLNARREQDGQLRRFYKILYNSVLPIKPACAFYPRWAGRLSSFLYYCNNRSVSNITYTFPNERQQLNFTWIQDLQSLSALLTKWL